MSAALFDLIANLPQLIPADGNGVIPDTSPEAPPGMDGFLKLVKWVAWGATIICVIAFLVSAGRLAMAAFSGREIEGAKGLVIALIASVIIGSTAAIFGALI